jgi:DNA-binding NarL/FixJ family response regulator
MRDESRPLSPVRVRLLLADPFTVFRVGVRSILSEADDFLVSEAASFDELEEMVASDAGLDVALVDLDLPPSGAPEAVALLRRYHVAPIVWSHRARLSPELVFELVRSGAMGVLTKEISPAGLVRALRGTTRGEAPLSRHVAWLLVTGTHAGLSGAGAARKLGTLSSRELEVLALVSEGHANKQIAARLCLSEFTVKRHIQNILRKIGVHSRWEASASYHAEHLNPMRLPLAASEAEAESSR